MSESPNIVWVDVETDGLNAERGHLLEVAVLVTDSELNVLDEVGFHAVVKYAPRDVHDMILNAAPVVQEMHEKTSLWQRLTGRQALPLTAIDVSLTEYLATFGMRRTMPVGGSSVRLDMNFMDRHLPLTAGFLDYHMRDVSSLAGFLHDWFGMPYYEKDPNGWHTADHDVRESIKEAQAIRQWAMPRKWITKMVDNLEAQGVTFPLGAVTIMSDQQE